MNDKLPKPRFPHSPPPPKTEEGKEWSKYASQLIGFIDQEDKKNGRTIKVITQLLIFAICLLILSLLFLLT